MTIKRVSPVDSITWASVGVSGVIGLIAGFYLSIADGFIIGIMLITLTDVMKLEYRERQGDLNRKRIRGLGFISELTDELIDTGEFVRDHSKQELLVSELERATAVFRIKLEDLRHGHISRPAHMTDDMIEMTDNASESICGVTNLVARSLENGISWWDSAVGKAYSDANRRAVERNVKIIRIFIVDELTDHVRELLDAQQSGGIAVRIAFAHKIDTSLHINLVIWDADVAWQPVMNASGEIIQNKYMLERPDVRSIGELFWACHHASVLWSSTVEVALTSVSTDATVTDALLRATSEDEDEETAIEEPDPAADGLVRA